MTLTPAWIQVLSELFTNLAAGWLGAILIVPLAARHRQPINLNLLFTNVILAILSLKAAVALLSS